MSQLSPHEPSIATAGADLGRRKASAHEARGAQSFVVTSTAAVPHIAATIEAMLADFIPDEVISLPVRTAEPGKGFADHIASGVAP